MDLIFWILSFIASSVFWKWILSWGGAQWLEGWKAFWFLEGIAGHWSAEQIRLYALVGWLLSGIGFIAGLIYPPFA